MMEEHCYMRGHDKQFDCSLHYESNPVDGKPPTTTAKEEWEYVVNGTEPSCLQNFKAKEGESHKRNALVFKNRSAELKKQEEELKKDPNKNQSEFEPLSEPERLGLALYTGPMVCYRSLLTSSSF
jgi:hypothetical protein